jgi:hypothetical protein
MIRLRIARCVARIVWLVACAIVWLPSVTRGQDLPAAEPVAQAVEQRLAQAPEPKQAQAQEQKKDAPPPPPDIVPDPYRWRRLEPQGLGVSPRNPLYDPYAPNVLKGDYPLFGDKVFFAGTATFDGIVDYKRNLDYFQNNRIRNVPFYDHNVLSQMTGVLAAEIFHGDTVFAPKDWSGKVSGVGRWRCGDLNATDFGCGEDFRFFEAFGEAKLFEIGNTFDPTSLRAGLQGFNSDFFGFIYNDVQPGARLFSEIARNRFKTNFAFFERLNKEKLSGLNEFKLRDHRVGVVSLQWDDFILPGFNILPNFVWSNDRAPGVVKGGVLDAFYIGVTTNGRIDRFNVNSAFYYVTGTTARNTPNGRTQFIQAGFAFAQAAYPIAYWNPRFAIGWASGDPDPRDNVANGFDPVFDNVNFAGGQFSYLFGEKIQLGATTVLRGNSIFPSLRGANATSQYVNPGVLALNPGVDVALAPTLTAEANYAYVRFDDTATLVANTKFKGRNVSEEIGHEFNGGLTWKPLLNEQLILFGGGAVFLPAGAVKDLFGDGMRAYKVIFRAVVTF